MTTKPTCNTVVHPPNHPVPIGDPLRLLPRSLIKLYSIWVSLTHPFASKGHSLSVHCTCDCRQSVNGVLQREAEFASAKGLGSAKSRNCVYSERVSVGS
jgi:hypothetical protein